MSFQVYNPISTTQDYLQQIINTIIDNAYSIGDYKFSVENTDNNYWLLCDGRSLSRSEYSQLFNVIGTNFGSIDNEHFNLPDLKGKIFGQSSSIHPIGQNVGTETVTLDITQIPSHNHTATAENSGIHNHTGTADAAGIHNHTSNANGGQGGLGLVTADGTQTATETDNSNGELKLWTTPTALSINNAGEHTHNLSINNSGEHTHTLTVNNTGGGLPHNNMQPTLFAGNTFILFKLPYIII
jgi:microcystin-dependent protein